ncbi:MAG: diacylglycerol kinase family protein [Polyangiaceae bacterium]
MRRVVIVNRNAGRLVDEGPLLDALRRRRSEVTVCETASVAELGAAITGLYDFATPELIAFAGGDGTYMAGLSALERERELRGLPSLPRVALLPGGTVCTVARSFGFAHGGVASLGAARRVQYIDDLLDAIACGADATTTTPTLRVKWSDVDGRRHERLAFIFGAGLVSRFFDMYYEGGGPAGLRRAALIVTRVFAGAPVRAPTARRILTPVACTLEIDGADSGLDRASLVVASVLDDLGLGMRLTYRARERGDRFHAVASALGPETLAPQLPLVLMGEPLLGQGVDALASRMRLRFDAPGSWVLDGDVLQSREVEVALGPTLDVATLRR